MKIPPPGPPPRLADRPRLFTFDAAVRLMLLRRRKRKVVDAVALRASSSLAYPAVDVTDVEVGRALPELALGIPGLAGASGPLPWHYSGLVRNGGTRLRSLFDLLANRFLAALAEAGIKYRLDRAVETARIEAPAGEMPHSSLSQHEVAILSVAGFSEFNLAAVLGFGVDPLLYYARLFVQQPHTSASVRVLACDWLAMPVEVVEFTGRWVAIAPDQRTRLARGSKPGVYDRLGFDAAIGEQTFDAQSRMTLRLGPMGWTDFCSLLPGEERLRHFKQLVRAFLGRSQNFTIQPVLAASEVPRLRLTGSDTPGPLLSRTTWLDVGHPKRRRDADDALFHH